ncbi:MAG: hypothetical protein ABFS56_15685 [Pseudomonadota bacterium]
MSKSFYQIPLKRILFAFLYLPISFFAFFSAFGYIFEFNKASFSHVFFIIFIGIYMVFLALGILENRGWIYIAVIAATVSHFLIALYWIKSMPILAIILMVIALSFLGLLKFARQLQEMPKLELPEPILVPEEKVPEKKI